MFGVMITAALLQSPQTFYPIHGDDSGRRRAENVTPEGRQRASGWFSSSKLPNGSCRKAWCPAPGTLFETSMPAHRRCTISRDHPLPLAREIRCWRAYHGEASKTQDFPTRARSNNPRFPQEDERPSHLHHHVPKRARSTKGRPGSTATRTHPACSPQRVRNARSAHDFPLHGGREAPCAVPKKWSLRTFRGDSVDVDISVKGRTSSAN
jgi:hypothetical protein